MPEIDPVLLEFHARVSKFQSDVRASTRTVEEATGRQSASLKRLDRNFERYSASMGGSIKGLVATLATAFTGRELIRLSDSFTRLQNNLRVSGQEGAELARVQSNLLGISQRYGVNLEALSSVFLKASLAQNELGASTEEITRLNEIVAASLKVTGTSTEQARGALLQLGQALGSDVVRGEEFNSLLENALPLVQAAARGIDRYGGSVAKLRADVVESNVSSQEFFQGILRGGIQTISDAEKATLTLAGGFEALTSSVTVYFGEADKANGVSAALGQTFQGVADNLDILIPALSIVIGAIGTRYVAAIVTAAASSVGLRAASVALAVQLNGVTAAATLTRTALLSAFGGPVGLAIGAVTIGLTALAGQAETAETRLERLRSKTDEMRSEADRMEAALRAAGVELKNTGNDADRLAGKLDGAARSAHNLRQELLRTRLEELSSERTDLSRTRSQLRRSISFESIERPRPTSQTASSDAINRLRGRSIERLAELQELGQQDAELLRQIELTLKAIENNVDPSGGSSGGGAAPTPETTVRTARNGSASSAPSGPTEAELQQRFFDEMEAIQAQQLGAQSQVARSAEERAAIEQELIGLAQKQASDQIAFDNDYSPAQKAKLQAAIAEAASAERAALALQLQAELEQQSLDLAEERGRAKIEALRLEFDLADTGRERRDIALRILDAEQDLLRSRLETIKSSNTREEAYKEAARIALEALDTQSGDQREAVKLQFLSPLERFSRDAKETDTRVEEAAVRRIERLNETVSDAMTNALGIEDPFLRDLIGIFLDKNVFAPLAEGFSGGGGFGGGAGGGIFGQIGGFFDSIFGRSSGGRVNAGQLYRVNEGAAPGRVEGFVPNTSGQIIPLGQMNAAQASGAGSGGVVRVMIEEAPGFATRVRTEATGVAVEVVRGAAGELVDLAANETIRRVNRPSL